MKTLLTALFLFLTSFLFGQGTETFSNIPASFSNYAVRTWTGDNGLTWTANTARTDQTMNGPAIVLDGRYAKSYIECENIPNGISSLSFNHQQFFTGGGNELAVFINGDSVAWGISVTTTLTQAVIENISVPGNFTLRIRTNHGLNIRIGVDDVSWTAFDGSGSEPKAEPTNHIENFQWLNVTTATIGLAWSTSTGDVTADGYLIKGSLESLGAIISPTDGVEESSIGLVKRILKPETSYTFTGLTAETDYFFKIFPFTNSGTTIDYKTDGEIPGVEVSTLPTSGGGGGGEIPSGYYATAIGSGSTLKTQLYNIIKGHTSKSYSSLYTHFVSTDSRPDGKIWDMYSNISWTHGNKQCGSYSKEGDCYNREHSFPASWYNDASPMYSDLFHLYPTDGYVNNRRGNFPFGKVGSATYTSANGSKVGSNSTLGYSGTVFEPIDEYKGDFARTVFYMVTRYENIISNWENNNASVNAVLNGTTFPALEEWALKLYYQWHLEDEVSEKEIDRNHAVYQIQNNRNPFIDHPQFVQAIWSTSVSVQDEYLPTDFSILNAYPNPFNPSTTVEFSIPTQGELKVQLINILGQKIRTESYSVSAGKFILPVELTAESSGIYFLQTEFNGYTKMKKLVLVK